MDENTMLFPLLPKFTRTFPIPIEFLLPLRFSARNYSEDGGVVPIFNKSPETDENENASGEMYAMTIQVAICGHAAYVKPSEASNGFMQVCEPIYVHTNANEMSNMIEVTTAGSLKWVNRFGQTNVKPVVPPNRFVMMSAMAYQKYTPLSAYTNVAATEAANHSGDSNFWRTLYPPMELIECHYGLAGLLYDNNVLSTGDMAGNDDNPVIENRKPSPHHRGFIDVCFTPQSKGAGRVRMLTFGVAIRVMTRNTIRLAQRLLSVVGQQMGNGFGDWILRCMGFTTMVTHDDVIRIVSEWKIMCEFNMPTVHVFESIRVIVISVNSGVLIRPVRTIVKNREFVRQGPFVDSMCVYHSDTMRYLSMTFPRHDTEPMQFNSTSTLLINFHRWTTEPRINLGIQMTMQAMNLYPIKGDATMVSLGENEPVIRTDVMDAIMAKSTPDGKIVVPGRNVVVAFINRSLNTEDACSVSKEFAEWGPFAWMGYIDYPLPNASGSYPPGTVLENEEWWKPAMKGLITNVFANKSGGRSATTAIYSQGLKVGDKLATQHGLKFTVGELIPHKDMPTLADTKTGERFKPNVMISTKNLARGLGGQIREMSACTTLFSNVSSFRSLNKPAGKTVFSQGDELGVDSTIPSAYVTVDGQPITFREEDGSTRTVKCNYGIMRLLQLRHTSTLKQHYPSAAINSITVPRGRYRQGTPRAGETELLSMMMQGLNTCVSEAVVSSDKANLDICSKCSAIPYFCDCPVPKPDTTKVGLRYSAVQLNTYATIGMLNDGNGNPMTLRYLTSS